MENWINTQRPYSERSKEARNKLETVVIDLKKKKKRERHSPNGRSFDFYFVTLLPIC